MPATVAAGKPASFAVSYQPANATGPMTWTWSPAPDSNPIPSEARYSWSKAGRQQIGVRVVNCGDAGDVSANHTVTVTNSNVEQKKYLPEVQQ